MPHRLTRAAFCLVAAFTCALCAACTSDYPLNPSFPLTVDRARSELSRMHAHPKTPVRPIVFIGGLYDVGFAVDYFTGHLQDATSPDAKILGVCLWNPWTNDGSRDYVIDAVEKAYPSSDPQFTTEVDVVGFSYGGIIGRYAAMPNDSGRKRLKIASLFTISAPHQGAVTADQLSLNFRVDSMRPGSALLTGLTPPDQLDYPIIPYARLGDEFVEPQDAAPPGVIPWWVNRLTGSVAHSEAHQDPRFMADIAARVRGERSFTRPPPQWWPMD